MRYPLLFWVLISATVGVQIGQIVAPIYLGRFLNIIAESTPGAAVGASLYAALFLFGFFLLLSWAFRRVQTVAIVHQQTRVMADIEEKSFAHLIGHSYHFFISHFAGSLVRKVARYKRSYEIVGDAVVLQMLPTTLLTAGIILVLSIRHPILGISLALWTLFFVSLQYFLVRHLNPLRLETSKEDSKVTGVLADAVGNHATITLFAGFRFEQNLFAQAVDRLRAVTLKAWLAEDLIWATQGFLMVVINVSLMWGAMLLWQKGVVTVGDFGMIQAYLLTLFERLFNIGREMRHVFTAYADATEMSEILHTPHGVQDKPDAQALSISKGEISFEKTSFSFGKEIPVLSNFNLPIRGGEKVALVGPSGGGKSTITKLLLRLYDVSSGSIRIDGQDVADVTQDSLREAIAFVPQEPVLFHRTLMDNIRYGKRGASDEEVVAAAQKAHCHEFIEKLPLKYSTFVGERGIKLSGGERQRIAIARAILKDAPILVLDEATSSLDSESEHYIQDALNNFMEHRTVLVIAHRLSTIMKMDRIVVIEQGQVAASGTHAELLQTSPLYKKLWSIQAGGFIPHVPENEIPLD